MGSKPTALAFTWDADHLMDELADGLAQALFDKTIQKARREGQKLITEADVRACLREALDEVAAKGLEAAQHVGG